jgi:hypothetical protein
VIVVGTVAGLLLVGLVTYCLLKPHSLNKEGVKGKKEQPESSTAGLDPPSASVSSPMMPPSFYQPLSTDSFYNANEESATDATTAAVDEQQSETVPSGPIPAPREFSFFKAMNRSVSNDDW